MDHNIDPNHIPHCDNVTNWALLEGKSEAAARDLEQQNRHSSQTITEKIQTALGIVVVLGACCLSAWSALRGAEATTAEAGHDDAALAQREFHFRP